ncbi:MAG: hypothetical protein ACHREM_31445 [Polyangiales bacterium]
MSSWFRKTPLFAYGVAFALASASGLVACVGDATDVDAQPSTTSLSTTPTTKTETFGAVPNPNGGDTPIEHKAPQAVIAPAGAPLTTIATNVAGPGIDPGGGVDNGPPPPHPWIVPTLDTNSGTSADGPDSTHH